MSRDRGHGRGFRGRFTRPFRPFRGQRGYLRGSSFRGNSRGRGHLIENYSQSSHDFSSSHKCEFIYNEIFSSMTKYSKLCCL